MAEYIEREALRQEIDRIYQKHFAKSREKFVQDVFKAFFKRIDKAPAADVAPARHGRWIKTIRENSCAEWTDFTCSVCGSVFDGNDWLFSEWKGCPVCLAKMDLEGGAG